MNAEEVVNTIMGSFGSKDLDLALSLVSEDVYYDNVPVGDMRGKEAMREFLAPMMNGEGLITFWRDYFDNGMFIKQIKG